LLVGIRLAAEDRILHRSILELEGGRLLLVHLCPQLPLFAGRGKEGRIDAFDDAFDFMSQPGFRFIQLGFELGQARISGQELRAEFGVLGVELHDL